MHFAVKKKSARLLRTIGCPLMLVWLIGSVNAAERYDGSGAFISATRRAYIQTKSPGGLRPSSTWPGQAPHNLRDAADRWTARRIAHRPKSFRRSPPS